MYIREQGTGTPATVDVDLQGIAAHRRASVWTDILSGYYYALDAKVPDGFGPAHIESHQLDDIRAGILKADPMYIHRATAHTHADTDEYMTFMLPADTTCTPFILSQNGRDARTDCRSIAFIGTSVPYSYDQPTHTTVHTLRIPAALVRARIPGADRFSAVRFDEEQNPMTSLVLAMSRALCANAARFSGRLAPGLQDQFLDLLALMMANADPHTGESAVRTAHRQRAVLLVEKRFRDPEFTACDVAAEINLSERYLQKLFADDDQTVSGTIRGRRIAEARKLLEKRTVTGSSIASIAAASGFADAAYFSRVFRQETGVSPTAYVNRSAEETIASPADQNLM
ncbi:helix-turn-helix domain-containing protein [Gordonia sp. NPDC003376]